VDLQLFLKYRVNTACHCTPMPPISAVIALNRLQLDPTIYDDRTHASRLFPKALANLRGIDMRHLRDELEIWFSRCIEW
jgi:hypothetical protein